LFPGCSWFACFALLSALTILGAAIVAFARLMTGHHREIQRRYREGRCLNCGYDLRTNPQGRGPECGKFT
jgi:hypothetical protein